MIIIETMKLGILTYVNVRTLKLTPSPLSDRNVIGWVKSSDSCVDRLLPCLHYKMSRTTFPPGKADFKLEPLDT